VASALVEEKEIPTIVVAPIDFTKEEEEVESASVDSGNVRRFLQ